MADNEKKELLIALDQSKQARLRAWNALQRLRNVLNHAGQDLKQAAQNTFVSEGTILEQSIRNALDQRNTALRELAAAARSVDQAAFKTQADYAQPHQALIEALEKAERFATPKTQVHSQSTDF